uniref:Uncharacterized protein n=1 Tax=Glossina austeni TaxID=7395 RepID=A0A1A9V8S3_GLOAU
MDLNDVLKCIPRYKVIVKLLTSLRLRVHLLGLSSAVSGRLSKISEISQKVQIDRKYQEYMPYFLSSLLNIMRDVITKTTTVYLCVS